MTPALLDLLATIREFLRTLAPSLTGPQKFDSQIAAYLLGIAEREVRFSAAVETRSQARLSAFLGSEGDPEQLTAELCAAIRSGELDDRWEEALALVLAETVDQVRLSRPDHLAAEHAAEPDRSPS